jgi:hypothetical protein
VSRLPYSSSAWRIPTLAGIVALTLAAAACEDDDDDVLGLGTAQQGPHELTLSAVGNRTTIADNDTVTVSSTITNTATGNTLSFAPTFRSLDPTIATVSGAGLVTGASGGTARIEALAAFNETTYGDTIPITVTP